MEATKKTFLEFLSGGKYRELQIPLYQRHYDWGTDQLERLWDDLKNLPQDKKEHFFGSITYMEDSDAKDISRYIIIDG